ncbi:MAG: ribbon-helix-helix protein, CopG family [Acidimicrobiales bacterium]
MPERVYDQTKSGELITEQTIEQLAEEAERGYEPGQLRARRRGRGRPPMGEAAKVVDSVRLEPALRAAAAQRAEEEGTTVSEVIRRALREYVRSA